MRRRLHTCGMASSPDPRDGDATRLPRSRKGKARRTPWLLALLLVMVFAALIALLALPLLAPARLAGLMRMASPAPTATDMPWPTLPPRPTPAPSELQAPTTLPSALRFGFDPATIEYVPRRGRCDWLGVAGRVARRTGEGLQGLRVQVQRVGSDETLEAITDSGGNFELRLAAAPLLAPWDVQLLDANGAMLSDSARIVTSDSCNQNLLVLMFDERR